jgi:hypothetical protein
MKCSECEHEKSHREKLCQKVRYALLPVRIRCGAQLSPMATLGSECCHAGRPQACRRLSVTAGWYAGGLRLFRLFAHPDAGAVESLGGDRKGWDPSEAWASGVEGTAICGI